MNIPGLVEQRPVILAAVLMACACSSAAQPIPSGAAPMVSPTVPASLSITPAGFRISGASLISEEELQASLSPYKGRTLSLAGLQEAAASLRRLYVARGYPLTDVHVPAQQFEARGGIVQLTVVEARIGKLVIHIAGDVPVRARLVQGVLEQHIVPEQALEQGAIDRAVLLLRDMPAITASARVSPGAKPGESDVDVQVSRQRRGVTGELVTDNHGTTSVGRSRVTAGINVDNLLGYGDTLSASATKAVAAPSGADTQLYRVAFRTTVNTVGTKLTLSKSLSQYQLGGVFAPLQASGQADVTSVGVVHPVLRSHNGSLFATFGTDNKTLRDKVDTIEPERGLRQSRAGLSANWNDGGLLGGAHTQLALQMTVGNLDLRDRAALADDQLSSGPQVAGSFKRHNLDIQRVEFLTSRLRLYANASVQWASKNLTSAEKMLLAGPNAVRGYALNAGTVVDSGAVLASELRYLLPLDVWGLKFGAGLLFDAAVGTPNRLVSLETNALELGRPQRYAIHSAGVGLSVLDEGSFSGSLTVSQALGNGVPGQAKPKTQAWATAQKVF